MKRFFLFLQAALILGPIALCIIPGGFAVSGIFAAAAAMFQMILTPIGVGFALYYRGNSTFIAIFACVSLYAALHGTFLVTRSASWLDRTTPDMAIWFGLIIISIGIHLAAWLMPLKDQSIPSRTALFICTGLCVLAISFYALSKYWDKIYFKTHHQRMGKIERSSESRLSVQEELKSTRTHIDTPKPLTEKKIILDEDYYSQLEWAYMGRGMDAKAAHEMVDKLKKTWAPVSEDQRKQYARKFLQELE